MTSNKKTCEVQEAERKCRAIKNWESVEKYLIWFRNVVVAGLSVIGLIFLIYYIMSLFSVETSSSSTVMFDKVIIAVLLLGVFSFALCKIFRTKTRGFGPFTSSTLIITLTLMVVSIIFLFEKIESRDITNILLAIVGFAGGLVAGRK